MESFVSNFLDQNEFNSIVVLGPSRCGKTTKITELISQFNVLRPNYETLNKHEDLVTLVDNFIKLHNVHNNSIKSKEKIIFFDDFDIIVSQNRYTVSFVKEQILTKKNCKFIFTCSNKFEKNISEIKKCSVVFKIENIVESKSYYDKNIYDLVHDIFDECDKGVKDMEIAISSDQLIISFILYDNFINYFKTCHKNKSNETFYNITKMYADMTFIEDYLSNVDNFLFDITSLCKCYSIRCQQKQYSHVKNKRIDINYTQITSRSAQSYNVKKKLNQELFYSFSDIDYISVFNKQTKKKVNTKSNLGMLCSSYTFNFLK